MKGHREQTTQSLVYSKQPFKQVSVPRKISSIEFGVQSSDEACKVAVVQPYANRLYDANTSLQSGAAAPRTPVTGGVLDQRMGVSRKTGTCTTCGLNLQHCTGHFGYIRLELPVFHIGFFRYLLLLCQCVCKSCARILITDDEQHQARLRLRHPRMDRQRRVAVVREVVEKCKKTKQCPHCFEFNGKVKKATGFPRILHDRYTKDHELSDKLERDLRGAMAENDQIKTHIKKVVDVLNPVVVAELASRVPDADVELLNMKTRPENLLCSVIPVPPVCIRPSSDVEGGMTSEDDITVKLLNILEVNMGLRHTLAKGQGVQALMEAWDMLQHIVAAVIDGKLPGFAAPVGQARAKVVRGFVQRLKGKHGRFRGNLSGKRVDFSGRSVISPDPNLSVTQMAVPRHVALTMTYPERVSKHNIEKLRTRIINGVTTHPGANFLIRGSGSRQFLKYGDRRRMASELAIGDVVERHLDDGDIVLFNRQPSLHRVSIMCHKVKVLPWRTFRFNECVCAPYNADFDGDEMNIHVPQTEEARAEAACLMASSYNLRTPKDGAVLISATQDFLTCSFLLTRKDTFFTRAQMGALTGHMGDGVVDITLPTPVIVKPVELWTGKQLFSLLLQPNTRVRVRVTLHKAEKTYSGGETLSVNDSFVYFRNSYLVSGQLGKGTLGASKEGLFGVLVSEYGHKAATAVMNRLSKLSSRYMGDRGLSIGIDDVYPSKLLVKGMKSVVQTGYSRCDDVINLYQKGQLEAQAGFSVEETLEAKVTGMLNDIREQASKHCMSSLQRHNAPLIMSQCGSKGSPINIAQMVACLGQQVVGGKRCLNGFTRRTLPHFKRDDHRPAARGFVEASFFAGLSPTDFFFHTSGGREGLVDTAVKTAETGYMSRRLMKALEDLHVNYDYTVRNASSDILQIMYGEDGLEPVLMEGSGSNPIHIQRTLSVCEAYYGRLLNAKGVFRGATWAREQVEEFKVILQDVRVFLERVQCGELLIRGKRRGGGRRACTGASTGVCLRSARGSVASGCRRSFGAS